MLGETASADHEAAARYPETLKRIVEEGGYTEQQIFNVDETGLFWKRMPTRTYLSHNETTQHGYTVSKDRLTLLLGGNAKGDFKVKPMLVYRSPNPRALKGHSQQSLPVIWRANKKAWITKALFEEWFSTCFCPAVEQYCKRKNIAYKALLILDNAPGHPITLGQFNESVKVTFLPPNTTSLIQPMDQAIIGTFKAYYLRETFQQAIAKTTDDNPISLVQFWKNYNIKNAIDNIANAWQKVSENNMRAGWKFIMPHCANNLRDLPAQIQHVIEEITDMGINKLGMEDLDAENVKEMIESHSEELINEDLLNLDQHCAFVDEDDDDEQPSRNKKSDFSNKDFEEIFSMVETLKQKVMDADPDTDRSTRIRREMDSIFLPYEQIYEQRKMVKPAQTTLMQFFDMDK
uniref:DDE-1 domain-containing protein n=1 Tax=Trichuris muris TaxID=70415 RepID=A0A5S6Q0H6_TRIMR